jgi:hypothetical protein
MAAAVVILVGTPILGLTFSLPGGARAGFIAIGILYALTALVVRRGRREPAVSDTSPRSTVP